MPDAGWKQLLADSITTGRGLAGRFSSWGIPIADIDRVRASYPMRITPFYASLIKRPGDPLWRQAVPDVSELDDRRGMTDPLCEDRYSPVPNITHRYPDRALFLVSSRCALYCRFCTRKRKIGRDFVVNNKTIEQGLAYIREHREIADVLLSGGDPFLLEDDELEQIVSRLRDIPHVNIIRIGTRVPAALPQRVTVQLARRLGRWHPLYINTHFNHPDELTPEAVHACGLLSDAGIPLGCQTVLLKGVNDSPKVMKPLMHKLLGARVRPYYLHHMDCTRGTQHFCTSIAAGLSVVASLRGHTSGMGVPHYVIDLPGGGGKVPLTPDYVIGVDNRELVFKNYQNRLFRYPLSSEDIQLLGENIGQAGRLFADGPKVNTKQCKECV